MIPRSRDSATITLRTEDRYGMRSREAPYNGLQLRTGGYFTRGTGPSRAGRAYSHSMVAGGFDDTSYTTRLIPRTSLMMREERRASSS